MGGKTKALFSVTHLIQIIANKKCIGYDFHSRPSKSVILSHFIVLEVHYNDRTFLDLIECPPACTIVAINASLSYILCQRLKKKLPLCGFHGDEYILENVKFDISSRNDEKQLYSTLK